MEDRRCPIHNEVLAYYCMQDACCICASCHVAEEHRGHEVRTLEEASEEKKQALRNVLQTLIEKTEELKIKEAATEGAITDVGSPEALLLRDLWRHLEYVEESIRREISDREEQAEASVGGLVTQLATKKEKLSRRMGHLEEMLNISSPLAIIRKSDSLNVCDFEEGEIEFNGSLEKQILANETDSHDYLRMNEALRGMSAAIGGINPDFYLKQRTNWKVDLDRSTAAATLQISENLDSASHSERNTDLPETPERFRDHPQVLSIRSCSSGRHFWNISFRKTCDWGVGMCYPSMDRAGEESLIGSNRKSWCVRKINSQVSAEHGGESAILRNHDTKQKDMKMYLNYEAGQLSFYEEGDWFIEHLHTFTATFTEPLHVVLYVGTGTVRLNRAETIGAVEYHI